jgi:two-component system, response regulator
MSSDGGPSVLVVESDREQADLVLLVFGENDLGETVRVARTVEDAVDLLFAHSEAFSPHLILLGVARHGRRELELAQRLRSDWRTKTIPLILVAATAEEADREEWRALGVSSFIVRPLDFEKLVEAASTLSLWWRALARTQA